MGMGFAKLEKVTLIELGSLECVGEGEGAAASGSGGLGLGRGGITVTHVQRCLGMALS